MDDYAPRILELKHSLNVEIFNKIYPFDALHHITKLLRNYHITSRIKIQCKQQKWYHNKYEVSSLVHISHFRYIKHLLLYKYLQKREIMLIIENFFCKDKLLLL